MKFKLSSNSKIEQYISKQAKLDTLRFITCGSVDDGKSTLIGRILFEAKMIFDDQIEALKTVSKKSGTQQGEIDFALLVDGLSAERQQGITIDVAYRYFSTSNRKFIVADTPGHEQYTRNMVTGASTADVAVILVDARHGILAQTRRHSIICSSLGIRKVLLAINKMDLIDYDQSTFETIFGDYKKFAQNLEFTDIMAIPVSALKGDNITQLSTHMSWYKGATLIGQLENIVPENNTNNSPLRLPIQWVNRPNLDFRGYAGTVENGTAKRGQSVKILPSGERAKITDIVLYKSYLEEAKTGQAVTVLLDRDVDVSRGDILVDAKAPLEIADQFEISLMWMAQEPGFVGRTYKMKIGTSLVNAQIMEIKRKIDINSFHNLAASKLELNDLSVITISIDAAIPFDKYNNSKAMGGLILIDCMTNQTVAAGMINYALRRANNVHKQMLDVNRLARQKLNKHTSKVLWFTGISGSGKSTIANAVEQQLYRKGIRTYILDGDNLRHGLNKDLGFTDADRVENIRRVSEVAKLMVDAGIVVITAFISPFRSERLMARNLFGEDEFFEIFVDTPLEIAEKRDPKGLYKLARDGKLPNFTAIDSPYEKPENAEITVKTHKEDVDTIAKNIIAKLGL